LVVVVLRAELVVLQRCGVQRHDRRQAAEPVSREHGGHLGVHEETVERAGAGHPPNGAPSPKARPHPPVAVEDRNLRRPTIYIPRDLEQLRVDRPFARQDAGEVVAVSDVAEAALDEEADVRAGDVHADAGDARRAATAGWWSLIRSALRV